MEITKIVVLVSETYCMPTCAKRNIRWREILSIVSFQHPSNVGTYFVIIQNSLFTCFVDVGSELPVAALVSYQNAGVKECEGSNALPTVPCLLQFQF